MKVSDLIAEELEKLDIRHVFGIIGAGNVHLFESISKRGFTEIVCVHHEQAATMAIQTYYRTCGRLSAALVTTGAGSTNAITGVVSAWADSIPCIVIAGNEHSKYTVNNPLRMWGVQGFDSVQMVKDVTKYAVRVSKETAVYHLKQAAFTALSGRKGPCWIEISTDVQAGYSDTQIELSRFPKQEISIKSLNQVETVLESLKTAEKPLLWIGNGIRLSGAEKNIPILLESLGVPSLVSWQGLDMIDSNHPLLYGRAGVYGQRAANFILQNCDYLLAIGTRLALPQVGYDGNFAPKAIIDVVDIDVDEAHKHKQKIREAIICDAGDFIESLIARNPGIPKKTEWIERCDEYRKEFPWVEHKDEEGYINSYRFMEVLNKYLKPEQLIVTDMGTALLCAHQVLKLNGNQRLMTSTGLGEMGYGLPAAIGASFASNKGEVLCLNCDGGMMLNLQELQTIVHHQLPIKIVIFNNDGYLMIKHTQKALFGGEYVGTDKKSGVSLPDFGNIAYSFEIRYTDIVQDDPIEDIEWTIGEFQAHNGPMILEVFMHPEQPFYPKLMPVPQPDGSIKSAPLEDLSPQLPRDVFNKAMR